LIHLASLLKLCPPLRVAISGGKVNNMNLAAIFWMVQGKNFYKNTNKLAKRINDKEGKLKWVKKIKL
jgi:hypothetical protein